jgi:alkylhydroperoxidase family enzyme
VISEEGAGGVLKRMYDRMRDPRGPVDNILKIHSLNPAGLRAHYDLYKSVMHGPSELSRSEREMIAVVVSRLNDCHY